MDIYAETILDHYRNPRGKGPVTAGQWDVIRQEDNPTCGDAITVGLKRENDTITGIAWEGEGCAISQAAMSMLAEELEGKTTEDIRKLGKDEVFSLLGIDIGPRRIKCALLALHALKNAIRSCEHLPPQSWMETTEVTGQ